MIEQCYLKAWSYAKEHMRKAASEGEGKGAVAALHKEFVPNWTSDDFKAAVDALGEVLDGWGERMDERELAECERLWKKVLELEAEFWPDV